MKNHNSLVHLKVTADARISDVIARIQASGPVACALLYDESGRFVNIFTDGDVRRAFLAGFSLDDPAGEVHALKSRTERPHTVTASVNSTLAERKALFDYHNLRQLVLVDADGSPVSIIDYQQVNYTPHYIHRKFTAVLMAGGFGTRLRPLTEDTPKPMLKINGRPILEIILEKLRLHGADRVYIATHYLAEKIVNHFGNGEKFGVEIRYLHEEVPLGTGGALSLLPEYGDTTLVFNADILTNLDVGMLLAHHLRSDATMTIASTQYHFQVPFGVISEKDAYVTHIEEKPSFSFLVNSGIYLLSRQAFDILPASGQYNMTDVAHTLIGRSMPVSCFPIFEHWLDVGRPCDFDLASRLF